MKTLAKLLPLVLAANCMATRTPDPSADSTPLEPSVAVEDQSGTGPEEPEIDADESAIASAGRPAGWYGFENSDNKDREQELRNRCSQKFTRIPNPKGMYKFSDLCGTAGMRCTEVCDWEGNTKPCDDDPQGGKPDGSRIAFCQP